MQAFPGSRWTSRRRAAPSNRPCFFIGLAGTPAAAGFGPVAAALDLVSALMIAVLLMPVIPGNGSFRHEHHRGPERDGAHQRRNGLGRSHFNLLL
jgi:hypothetical protein